jgi:Ca2+-binding RTX toxin-like protein
MFARPRTLTPSLLAASLAIACGSDEKEQVRDPDNRLPEDQIRCSCRGCFFCNGPDVNDPSCPPENRVAVGDPASGFPGASCLLPPAAGSCTYDTATMQSSCEQACLTDNQIIAACETIELAVPACTALGCPGGTSSSSSPLMAAQPGDSVVGFSAALSNVNVSNGDESGDAPASGRAHVTLCAAPPCDIVFHYLEITSGVIELDDTELRDIRAIGHGPLTASWAADRSFTITGGGNMIANFNVDGDAPGSMEAIPVGAITGSIDPSSGAVSLHGVWRGPPGSLYEDLRFTANFGGALENQAPVANAGPDRVVECNQAGGALLTLDGTGSSDPEGNLRLIWVEGTTALAEGVTPQVGLALGQHALRAIADDHAGLIDQDEASIDVVDTTGPSLTATGSLLELCEPAVQAVQLPLPSLSDVCAPANIALSAEIVAIDGHPVPPIPVIGGAVTLTIGSVLVRWTASDVHGNSTQLEQTIELRESPSSACCKPGQQLTQASDGPDFLQFVWPASRCVLARGASDLVSTLAGSDYLSGGAGNDRLESRDVWSSSDVIVGNAGNDLIQQAGPLTELRAFGGAGNDVITAGTGAATVLYGNAGDDIITGGYGPDSVVPGPGRDLLSLGLGDDSARIYDVCEIEPGELLNGGLGNDTLTIPITLDALRALGVIVIGFENVQVDAGSRHLAECY